MARSLSTRKIQGLERDAGLKMDRVVELMKRHIIGIKLEESTAPGKLSIWKCKSLLLV